MSHDQNFKNLILDYPLAALQFFAAAEADAVNEQVHILPLREEQLQERLGERFRELDVPLLVEWPDGRRGALLFVLEEETEGRRFSIHRLAHYCLDLAELLQTERIVPVVIFLRAGEHPADLVLGGDRCQYLAFRYLACHLYDLNWQDWRNSDNLVARLNLPNMRYADTDRVAVYAAALCGLLNLEPKRRLKPLGFVDIYTRASAHKLSLRLRVRAILGKPAEESPKSAYLRDHFAGLQDPGVERNQRHELLDMVLRTVCAVLSGADGWEATSILTEGGLRS